MILEKAYKKIIGGGIKNKIKMFSIILLISDMVIIAGISYIISSSSIMDRIGNTNLEIISQSMGSIDFMLKSVENSALQAFESINLAEQLDKAKHGSPDDKKEVSDFIKGVITKLIYLRNEIDYIYIIGKDFTQGEQDGIYSNETYARLQVINEKEFRRLFEVQGDRYFWTYVVKEGLDVVPLKKIGLCRAILDETGDYKGFILIMLREGVFEDIYTNLRQNERQLYLIDQDGLIVASPDRSFIGGKFPGKFGIEDVQKTVIKQVDNRKYVITGSMSQYTGWKLYSIEPLENVISSVAPIMWWMAFAIAMCVLVFIALSVFLSSMLTKPIVRLKNRASTFKNYEKPLDKPGIKAEDGNIAAKKRRVNFRTKLFIMLITIIMIPEVLLMAVSVILSHGIVEKKIRRN